MVENVRSRATQDEISDPRMTKPAHDQKLRSKFQRMCLKGLAYRAAPDVESENLSGETTPL